MSLIERRALLVGIGTYDVPDMDLDAPAVDVEAMRQRLSRHEDKVPNFECLVYADETPDGQPITRAALREGLRRLFAGLRGDALFYFSGHGALDGVGGWLVTSDADASDLGVPMSEVVQLAADSLAMNVMIILDCCHSGAGGNLPGAPQRGKLPVAQLREDVTIMAASRDVEIAYEAGGQSLFTAALLDALDGGGADHMGWVTAPGMQSYVERRFGTCQRV